MRRDTTFRHAFSKSDSVGEGHPMVVRAAHTESKIPTDHGREMGFWAAVPATGDGHFATHLEAYSWDRAGKSHAQATS